MRRWLPSADIADNGDEYGSGLSGEFAVAEEEGELLTWKQQLDVM